LAKSNLVDVDWIAETLSTEGDSIGLERIRQLQREGVITPANKDTYKRGTNDRYLFDPLESLIGLVRYYRKKADTKYKSSSPDIENAKLSGQQIENEMRLLKLDEQRRELHRSDDIIQVFNSLMTRARVAMLGIGRAAFPQDKALADMIDSHINRALMELSTFNIEDFTKHGGAAYIEKLEEEAAFTKDDGEDIYAS